jgi:hypothetical protein
MVTISVIIIKQQNKKQKIKNSSDGYVEPAFDTVDKPAGVSQPPVYVIPESTNRIMIVFNTSHPFIRQRIFINTIK